MHACPVPEQDSHIALERRCDQPPSASRRRTSTTCCLPLSIWLRHLLIRLINLHTVDVSASYLRARMVGIAFAALVIAWILALIVAVVFHLLH